MSMILTARALQIKTGNPLRKLVLVKLADNANDQGESWPSVPYIAEQCEISERSVQNHINALVKMGLVRVESRKSANGLNQSNIYHLCLNATAVSGESPAPGISHDPVIDPDNKNINPVRGKAKSKTVMPENFAPTPEHIEQAKAAGLDIQDEFQKFSDYHASKGTQYVCWNSGFRYWLNTAAGFKRSADSKNIDTTECDEVFRKMFSSSDWKPENRVQELVAKHKSYIGRMNEIAGRAAFRGYWKQATEQAAKEREAA